MIESSMEPGAPDERVPDVQQPHTFSIDPGLVRRPGPPADAAVPRVFDLESHITVEVDGVDFHEFYVETRDRIGRALALTTGDADLASDAVDEAMVRAYQRWTYVRTLDNPGGWVYRVGLNFSRSRFRRLSRRLTSGPTAAGVSTEIDAEVPTTEPAIVRALGELSVDHGSVVVCRLLLDWSEADTATALKIKPGTVKSRLSRALTQLEPKLSHLNISHDKDLS